MRCLKVFAVGVMLVCLSACGNAKPPNDADVVTFSGTAVNEYEADTMVNTDEEDTEAMVSEGYFMPCTNGSYMLITDDNRCTELYPENGDNSIFSEFTVGDRVSVVHGIFLETHPGMTTLYSIEKLSDGTMSDIPADVLADPDELDRKAITSPDHSVVEIVPQCTPSMGFSLEFKYYE